MIYEGFAVLLTAVLIGVIRYATAAAGAGSGEASQAEPHGSKLVYAGDAAETSVEAEDHPDGERRPYDFAAWSELIEARRGSGRQQVLANPDWPMLAQSDGALRVARDTFLLRCERQGVSVAYEINEPLGDWIWTDRSSHLPFLLERGVRARAVLGESLAELLRRLEPFSLIALAVKDDGSQAFDHVWQEKLDTLGIHKLTREYVRHSYVNLIYKRSKFQFESLLEEISPQPLIFQFAAGSKLSGFKLPVSIEIESGGYTAGNRSVIRIGGRDYSENKRGLNLAVYNVWERKVNLSETIDTFVTMYRPGTIYLGEVQVQDNGEQQQDEFRP